MQLLIVASGLKTLWLRHIKCSGVWKAGVQEGAPEEINQENTNMFKKQVNSYIWGFWRGRLLYCPNFDMGDCLAWGDSFCSGSYFCCATYAGFFFLSQWQTSSSSTSLGSCLEGNPTLDLAHSSYSQADARGLHGRVMSGLLLRSAGTTTGRLGWKAGICRALDTCTRSAEKPAWFADRVVRKSRCHKNNPSWKKLSLPPMKLLCVQLPAMVFAAQGLSFAYVLT